MRQTKRAWAALGAAMVVAGSGAPASSGAAAKEEPRPLVTAAVQVSTNPDPARAHTTPQITRNPKNGMLVIADSEARTKLTVDVYRSADEGRSWGRGGDPMLKPWTAASSNVDSNIDHSMTYDKNGVLYIAFQANDPRFNPIPKMDRPVHVFLSKSTDDGATFTTVRVYEAPEAPEADRGLKRNYRPWVAVDPTDPRFVYVSWMQFHINDEPVSSGNKALIAASSDGGRTFDKPFSLREGDPQGSYEGRPAVDRKGVVHVTFAGRGRVPPVPEGTPAPPPPIRTVLYRSSSDHGRTWADAKQIEEGNAGFAHNRKWGLRADPSSDSLYAVWYGNPNPRAVLPADERDIYLRASYDSGRTWSDRVLVNDDEKLTNVHHFDPNLSVAPNGRIDIAWFDNRNSPVPANTTSTGAGFQDVYYTYSTDGGRTFAPNIKVTDRIMDRRYGLWQNNADIHAPIGIVSNDDTVYLTWQDPRNGTNEGSAEDTYFATVQMNGPVLAAGEADDGSGVPRPVLIGAGVAAGMGLAMLIVFAVSRRSPRT